MLKSRQKFMFDKLYKNMLILNTKKQEWSYNRTLCNLNLRSATNSIFERRRNRTLCNLNTFG